MEASLYPPSRYCSRASFRRVFSFWITLLPPAWHAAQLPANTYSIQRRVRIINPLRMKEYHRISYLGASLDVTSECSHRSKRHGSCDNASNNLVLHVHLNLSSLHHSWSGRGKCKCNSLNTEMNLGCQ